MKRKRASRFLSLLLTVMLVLCMTVTAAFAEDPAGDDSGIAPAGTEEEETIENTEGGGIVLLDEDADYEAQVGETEYGTLAEAIAAADSDSTVKLLKDITIEVSQNNYVTISGKNITIDLGENTIYLIDYSSNQSRYGGKVFNIADGVNFTLKNGTIDGSTPYGGSIIEDDSEKTKQCHAIPVYVKNTADNEEASGSVTLENVTFQYLVNSANGAIFVENSDMTVTGCNFINNGSAINCGEYGEMSISGCTFTGNGSPTNGGGINASAIRDKVTISENKLTGNSANTEGGAIALYEIYGEAEVIGNTITDGNTANYGGGIAIKEPCGGTVVISGNTISGNSAVQGGGISVHGATSSSSTQNVVESITLTGNTITGNEASSYGGGLCIYGITEGSVILDGEENVIYENTAASNGGGVYVRSAHFDMKGGKISDNRAASYGGGVYLTSNASMAMSGGTISGNTTTNYGGGVYLTTSASMAMSGGTISGNTTTNYGGGVYLTTSASMTMSGGTISGNTATGGGGICILESAMAMSGGTISGNTATSYGGGIYNQGTMTMEGGVISNNISSSYGGGMYNYSNSASSGTLTMSGGEISGNEAANSGGGIYNAGTITMEDGTISGNTASSGAGVYNPATGTLTMSGGAISGNTATGNGGGVYQNGTMNVSGTPVVTDNTGNGAGNNVYLPSGKYITLVGEFEEGAEIGVFTADKPSFTDPVEITTSEEGTTYHETAFSYFRSDENYDVEDYFTNIETEAGYDQLDVRVGVTYVIGDNGPTEEEFAASGYVLPTDEGKYEDHSTVTVSTAWENGVKVSGTKDGETGYWTFNEWTEKYGEIADGVYTVVDYDENGIVFTASWTWTADSGTTPDVPGGDEGGDTPGTPGGDEGGDTPGTPGGDDEEGTIPEIADDDDEGDIPVIPDDEDEGGDTPAIPSEDDDTYDGNISDESAAGGSSKAVSSSEVSEAEAATESDVPKTNDETNLAQWIILMIAALFGMCTAMLRRRNEQ